MVPTEGDWDGLRMTNLKKLTSFFKLGYPWRSSFKIWVRVRLFNSSLQAKIRSHTSFIPWASFFTGKQHVKGVRSLEMSLVWNSKVVLVLNLALVGRSKRRCCRQLEPQLVLAWGGKTVSALFNYRDGYQVREIFVGESEDCPIVFSQSKTDAIGGGDVK